MENIKYCVIIFNYPNSSIDIKQILEAEQVEEIEAELEQSGYRLKDIDWMIVGKEHLKNLAHQCITHI